MKELDPGTSLGIRDFEASLSSENGAILTREPKPRQDFGELFRTDFTVTSLRLLWENRSFLLRVAGLGLVLSTLFAFSIPNRYQSVAHLMPPDNHPSSGLGMAAAAFASGLNTSSLSGGHKFSNSRRLEPHDRPRSSQFVIAGDPRHMSAAYKPRPADGPRPRACAAVQTPRLEARARPRLSDASH